MPSAVTRLIHADDAAALAELLLEAREFFAPWDKEREDDYFTPDGQRAEIAMMLERHDRGEAVPHVILDDDGGVVGRITLNGIVRGPFQSCSLGYWLSPHANGRGYATRAVVEMTRLAFGELGLHRVQAETLRHNERSQRVLARAGFQPIGMAPRYLKIAGVWQDHDLFQLLADD